MYIKREITTTIDIPDHITILDKEIPAVPRTKRKDKLCYEYTIHARKGKYVSEDDLYFCIMVEVSLDEYDLCKGSAFKCRLFSKNGSVMTNIDTRDHTRISFVLHDIQKKIEEQIKDHFTSLLNIY